jgi:hypothetical protein
METVDTVNTGKVKVMTVIGVTTVVKVQCLVVVVVNGNSFLASKVGFYSYICSEHIWRNALSLTNQACSKHSSVCYSKI